MLRVLVVRNDKIGDFMLAWPAMALLKQAGCHLTALVPAYTEALAVLCPYIDDVLIDPGSDASEQAQKALMQALVNGSFDASLTLFSTWRVGQLLRRAQIPYRLAPATKLAQLLHNHRLRQRRSRSEKPEWEYNLDLAATLLKGHGLGVGYVGAPYLSFDLSEVSAHRARMAQQLSLPVNQPWMMVHAGSGGSANNLSIAQYEDLVTRLAKRLPQWVFVLTAGPQERGAVGQLLSGLINRQVPVAMSVGADLTAFTLDVAAADAFMAGSTGPLHIAGALDVPTIGFYTLRRSATALRWQTLNAPARRFAISPQSGRANGEGFDGLDIEDVAQRIADWLSMSPAKETAPLSDMLGI